MDVPRFSYSGATAITKAEWEALTANRDRPLTQSPLTRHHKSTTSIDGGL